MTTLYYSKEENTYTICDNKQDAQLLEQDAVAIKSFSTYEEAVNL
jgi:hypothetical protein